MIENPILEAIQEQKKRFMHIKCDHCALLEELTFSSPYLKSLCHVPLLNGTLVYNIDVLKQLRDYLDAHIRGHQFDPKNWMR